MSMNTEERNLSAKNHVLDIYSSISNLSIEDLSEHSLFNQADAILQNLISPKISAKGFRGVVLTAIVGKFLNPTFDFLNNFYTCNPRSIFENGIFFALEELKIPSGKSDPLNVAKNTYVLDMEWAKGKRPQRAAEAVVNYLGLLNNNFSDKLNYEYLVKLFMFRLKELSDSHSNITITPVTATKDIHQELAIKLWNFISTAVEGGTIPQFFIGILLEAAYKYSSNVKVEGTRESVSGTNTTSKKPGDLVLVRDTKAFAVLEITLKNVDYKRLKDSHDVLKKLGFLDIPITFICRIPQDIQTLKDVVYSPNMTSAFIKSPHDFNFIDMQSFLYSQISLLDDQQLDDLLKNLTEFIGAYDRPINTKNIWNQCFPIINDEI